MSPDSIPQLSLGTAALIIFLVCVGFVMLRGMTRMMIGTVVLATSAWLGFLVWREAPALSVGWFEQSFGLITTGLPIAVFLSAFFVIRKISNAIVRPFGKPRTQEKRGGPVRLAFRLLLALIPAAILWLVGATFIHHSGSVAEVRAYAEKPDGTAEPPPAGFGEKLKSSIENALPASWLEFLDPLASPSRLTLAKLIAAQSDSPRQPVIDPRTGEPIPRAIIVEDPELQTLAREGKFGTLLRHPLLTKALDDARLKELVEDLHL